MSKIDDQKQLVRQRDRFVCQYCGKPGEQYAHIVADADGGECMLENLVFLCYDHHNYWLESARAGAAAKAKLQEISKKLRDKPKQDGLYSRLFAWPAGDHCIVALGGGFKFSDHERILESELHPNSPYLSLKVNELGVLVINAIFEDENANEFMTISENKVSVDTVSAWDIVVERRRFSLIHARKKIELHIWQSDTLELIVTGNLFLNGGYYQITSEHILDVAYRNILSANQSFGGSHGLFLKPGKIMI